MSGRRPLALPWCCGRARTGGGAPPGSCPGRFAHLDDRAAVGRGEPHLDLVRAPRALRQASAALSSRLSTICVMRVDGMRTGGASPSSVETGATDPRRARAICRARSTAGLTSIGPITGVISSGRKNSWKSRTSAAIACALTSASSMSGSQPVDLGGVG